MNIKIKRKATEKNKFKVNYKKIKNKRLVFISKIQNNIKRPESFIVFDDETGQLL